MKKRILTLIICFALAFVLSGEMLLTTFSIKASAETEDTVLSYDETRIEDDIAHLDFTNYSRNMQGDPEVIYFTEYCYSVNSDVSSYYGLYVYVYNPTEEEITLTDRNKVEIAVEYKENGEANKFEKLPLTFLDKTDNNRFYKFKITDGHRLLPVAQKYASAHSGVRRYEIIEVELVHGTESKGNSVSKIYEFSGYGAYCDKDKTPISSLVCKDYGARSIHLLLDHTNYRFGKKDAYDAGHYNGNFEGTICDELHSVYFSVPESYFNDFGDLTKIAAEWYEYKTKYMFVTSDDGAYAALKDLRNIRINEFGQKIDENGQVLDSRILSYWRVFWSSRNVGFYGSDGMLDSWALGFGESFNPKCRDDIDDDSFLDSGLLGDGSGNYTLGGYQGENDSWTYSHYLNWLFRVEDVDSSDDYRISREEVEEYAKQYTKEFSNDPLILGKYASSLFVDSIDSDRIQFLEDKGATSGYVFMEFTAGEDFDEGVGNQFIDADTSQGWWDKFWNGQDYVEHTYSPIVTISEADLSLDNDTFSEKYYVSKYDVDDIKKFAKEELKNNKVPVLLRFAITDYYASTARFDYAEEGAFEMSDEDGYVAQQTCFLDFDVISLTFVDPDGAGEVVIGVVSDPIDIINGLTPPSDLDVSEQSWFKIIISLILLFILVIVLMPVLIPMFKFVVEGVTEGVASVLNICVRIVTWPFRALSNKNNNRRR